MVRKAIPRKIRENIYQKYGGRCAYCGEPIAYKDMQVDHIVSVYHAGANEETNYYPACRACNHYKGAMAPEKLKEELGKLIGRLEKIYIYRLAKRYGLVSETGKETKFYYEKCGDK